MSLWEVINTTGQCREDTLVYNIPDSSAGTQIWLRFLQGMPGTRKEAAGQQHEAAHALLWEGCASWMGQGGQSTQGVEFLRLPSGKPYLAGNGVPEISISHTNGLAACAFSRLGLGIDAEQVKPFPERVLRKVLSVTEQKNMEESVEPDSLFFCYWTLKEAYGKASGRGIAYPMPDVTFYPVSDTDGTGNSMQCIRAESICEDVEQYMFFQGRVRDYIISVCTAKHLAWNRE